MSSANCQQITQTLGRILPDQSAGMFVSSSRPEIFIFCPVICIKTGTWNMLCPLLSFQYQFPADNLPPGASCIIIIIMLLLPPWFWCSQTVIIFAARWVCLQFLLILNRAKTELQSIFLLKFIDVSFSWDLTDPCSDQFYPVQLAAGKRKWSIWLVKCRYCQYCEWNVCGKMVPVLAGVKQKQPV